LPASAAVWGRRFRLPTDFFTAFEGTVANESQR